MTSCRKVSNNKRGRYTDNLCWIHGIQVYASSEFTTAFQFTLFESAKAIVLLVNVMKMESSGFGLGHTRITTTFYLNSNKLATSYRTSIVCGQISDTLPFNKVSAIANLRKFIRVPKLFKRFIVQADDLPRFEDRFKELLNENTIREVANFQSQLARERESIRERITRLNESLTKNDYNPGRIKRLCLEYRWNSKIFTNFLYQ